MALSAGTCLGPYVIADLLGTGGMGEVYLARDQRLERRVALKLVSIPAPVDSPALTRFQREARALASLNHPNICTIYDICEDSGTTFIVLEYLMGETLAQRLRSGPMPFDVAAKYALQIADALRAAHRAGVLHRDVKPGNIMLVDMGIKLLDFGISRFLAHSDTTAESVASTVRRGDTLSGAPLGTLPYMSPEQLSGEGLDERTDIYGFGAVLYEMLSGRPPFIGGDNDAIVRAIRSERASPLSSLRPEVPGSLDSLVQRCLSKDVQSRWRSFEEVSSTLQNVLATAKHESVRRPRTGRGVGKIRSIAVLPFQSVQSTKADEYLADGLTELLISRVATIGALRVISRTSVGQYKQTTESLPTIARVLDVDSIIEGSVLRAGDRVRVTARLIDAANDSSLWSDTFDRHFDDVLAIQSEIADEISQHVAGTVSPTERSAIRQWKRVPQEAQDAYLRARFLWNKHESLSLEKSFEYYQSALSLAPQYPLVHAGIADWYHFAGVSRLLPYQSALKKARASAERALQLDSRLVDARASLARISHLEWDWSGAEKEFHRAIRQHSSCFNAHLWYASFLNHCNRQHEALDQLRHAAGLDPLNPRVYEAAAFCHYAARNFEAAVAEADRAAELQADSATVHYARGLALLFLGHYEAAMADFDLSAHYSQEHPSALVGCAACLWRAGRRDEAEQVLSRIEHSNASAYDRAEAFAACDQIERALACLEDAIEQRLPELVAIGAEPLLHPLRPRAAFQKMLEKVGVPSLGSPAR